MHDEFGSDCTAEFSFAASHFSEFSSSILDSLTAPQLHGIFSNRSLRLQDEDSLCTLICNHFKLAASWVILLDFVRLHYLHTSTVAKFANSLPQVFYFLSPWTLRVLGERLLSVHALSRAKATRSEFPYKPEFRLDGIIARHDG
jgi:hypothetical protein